MNKEDVLKSCFVEGNVVKLPQQLERNLYMEVAKVLEQIGGKWNRKAQGFFFEQDPNELLGQIANGEKRNLKKEFQFFETPAALAEKMAFMANLEDGKTVLEPSAGRGAIVKAVRRLFPAMQFDCFELMEANQEVLKRMDGVKVVGKDFLQEKKRSYDKIVANPPFSKNQDVDHIMEMHRCLNKGGCLVTVASSHWEQSSNKKETAFRSWLKKVGATVEVLPEGTFAESGTSVGARLIVIHKE